MVAIVGVALFFNRQMAGLLEFAIYWILSFPILIYTVRYGLKAALVPSISMILLSFMISLPTTMFYLASSLIVGLVYGAGVRRSWSNRALLASSIIFTFFSYVITTIIFASFFGYSPQDDIEMLNQLVEVMHISLPGGIANFVKAFIIITTVLMSVLQGLCIHLLAIVLMKRLKMKTNPVKPIFDIKVGKWAGYVCIVIWLLFLGINVVKLDSEIINLIIAAYFCVQIFAIGYGCITIMSIMVLQNRRKYVFFLPILAFVPFVNNVIMFIGIYDMFADLKGQMKRGIIDGSFRKL